MPRKTLLLDLDSGPRARELCAQRHISGAELARRSGLSPDIIRRIFRGERPMKPAERRSIARSLGLKVQDLAPPRRAEPGTLSGVEDLRQADQECDELRAQVETLREILTAERAARDTELTDLRDQHQRELADARARLHDDPERDELRVQVETLRNDLATRSDELAELRDQHMRELAELRTRLQALDEGQVREEKLATALDELDRRAPATPRSAGAEPGPTSEGPRPTVNKPSVAETLAGLAIGLGSVVFAFGTRLFTSKRT